MKLSQRAGLIVVRAYQLLLAPFTGGACRFEPSCSLYASEAIQAHGLLRGLCLALRRFSRCHPWSPAGVDPVPFRRQDPKVLETSGGSVLPRI
jgi:putative membrane protein insertion efficiency factor